MNNSISLQKAIEMTSRFQQNKNNIIRPEYIGQHLLLTSETFDREIFDAILGETGCVQLRVYSGMNPELQVKVIVVGVDAEGNDILPSLNPGLSVTGEDKYIAEEGQSCPPICAKPSPLNP